MKIISNSKSNFLFLYNDLLPNRQGLQKEKLRLITEKENTSITQWIKKQIKEYNL